MKSKTQHVDGGGGKQQFEAFRIWRLLEKWDLRNIVGSKKTHKFKSVSQRKGNANEIKNTRRWWWR